MDYRTRELLLSKLDRAVFAVDGPAQMLASFKGQMERYEWQIKAHKKLDPAEVHRMGLQVAHDMETALEALRALYKAMRHAYPDMNILWVQDCPAPWDPPLDEEALTLQPGEEVTRIKEIEKEKRPA